MTIPTAPYCDISDVSDLFQAEDSFANHKYLTTTKVNELINKVGHLINMKFAGLGYIVPFQTLSDESWPTYQTEYLKLLNVLGTVHLIKEYLTRQTGNRGDAQDIIYISYENEMNNLHNLLFRAKYYDNTKIAETLTTPTGPLTNTLSGDFDITAFQSFDVVTKRMQEIQNHFKDSEIETSLLKLYKNL